MIDERVTPLIEIMNEDWGWLIDKDEAEMILEAVDKVERLIQDGG